MTDGQTTDGTNKGTNEQANGYENHYRCVFHGKLFDFLFERTLELFPPI